MFRFSARLFDMPDAQKMLEAFGFQPGGPVQHAINEAVVSYSKQGNYVPASPNRILEDAVVTNDQEGWVAWNTPYAHYQWAGIVFVPDIPDIDPESGVLMDFWSPPGRPKKPTDRKLTYDKAQNPNAGPYWFERMKADHLNDIIRLAAEAAGRGKLHG